MKVASILVAGLAGVGLAAYALASHMAGEPVTEVVTLPQQRPAAEVVRTPTPETQKTAAATPGDRASLARELQRELQRVGCYTGEINGLWTTSSRMAMKAFTDRVNASLPIDAPDYILLSLVQRHQGKACGANCPGGQSLTEDGRCVPSAVLAKAAKTPVAGDAKPDKPVTVATRLAPTSGVASDVATDLRSPAIGGNTGLVPRGENVPLSAKDDERTRIAAAKPEPEPEAEADDVQERRIPRRAQRADGGPIPEVGVYDRHRHRHYSKSKPPKFVRKFLRSMQRTFAGVPF